MHTGRTDEAASRAEEALRVAREAGDGWNEGYALGTQAALAGLAAGCGRPISSPARPST